MPLPVSDDGGVAAGVAGTDSGSSQQPIVQDVLSTQAGSMAGGSGAVQLFSSPNVYRNSVLVMNNGTGDVYVGFTSDTSSTKYIRKLAAGESTFLNLSPQVDVYVAPDATGGNYTAHELRVR